MLYTQITTSKVDSSINESFRDEVSLLRQVPISTDIFQFMIFIVKCSEEKNFS